MRMKGKIVTVIKNIDSVVYLCHLLTEAPCEPQFPHLLNGFNASPHHLKDYKR